LEEKGVCGMNLGKCPKCDRIVPKIYCEGIDIEVPGGASWKGINHCCPFCHAVLSVQIDPIAIKTDIIDGLFKKLRSK
jgi:hypothetical protein